MNFDKDEGFSYIICKEVNSFFEVPQGMIGKTILASKYAVFAARGESKKDIGRRLGQVWSCFFTTWLP